jgi:hypothetical protein
MKMFRLKKQFNPWVIFYFMFDMFPFKERYELAIPIDENAWNTNLVAFC